MSFWIPSKEEVNPMSHRLMMFCIGTSAGLLLWFASPKTEHVLVSETRVVVKEVVKVQTKTLTKFRDSTVTITEPGRTTVIVEKEQSKENSASVEQAKESSTEAVVKETKPVKSRYSLLAGASVNLRKEVQYTLGAEARLGDTPLWLGVSGSGPIPTLSFHIRMEM